MLLVVVPAIQCLCVHEYTCSLMILCLCVIVSQLFGLIVPIRMEPVANVSLDNVVVGETINISCVIKSCGTPNVVEFINEQSEILQSITSNGDGVFNWTPMVDNQLSGSYYCVAQNPLGTASKTFVITHTRQSGGSGSTYIMSSLLLATMLLFLTIIYN